jgi:hypothetical protein
MRIHYWIFAGILSVSLLAGGLYIWRTSVQEKEAAIVWGSILSDCSHADAINNIANTRYTGMVSTLYTSSLEEIQAASRELNANHKAFDQIVTAANEKARRLYHQNSAFATEVNDVLAKENLKFSADELNYCSYRIRLEISRRLPVAKQ